jgi:hypothetical protein
MLILDQHRSQILRKIALVEKSERFRQAHPVKIVHQHRIGILRKPFSELFDPFRSLLQSYQMSFWILVSKLMIGNNSQSILQRLREDNVILIHGSKVSSGRGRIQEVSHKEERPASDSPVWGRIRLNCSAVSSCSNCSKAPRQTVGW